MHSERRRAALKAKSDAARTAWYRLCLMPRATIAGLLLERHLVQATCQPTCPSELHSFSAFEETQRQCQVTVSDLILSTSDQTLERQNDEELNSLHGKIKALRSVRASSGEVESLPPDPGD